MTRNKSQLLFLLLLLISSLFSSSDGAANAVMSIDLGSEYLKLALVKPGVPMEIVLNRESQRKTPFALTIKQEERFFGSEALRKGANAARNTYTFFLDLVGKPFSHPAVQNYQEEFPYLQLKNNEQRGGVNFVTDAGEIPVETLLAMVLANARTEVEAYAGQPVKDTVIAVPINFGPSEREAVNTAAQIAGLNLLQLLTSGASAALNYGVFRYKDITEQAQTLLIYDVGSTKVQATVVRYSLSNDNATPAPNATPVPKLEVIGYDAELQLGGHYLTLKLRQRLVEAFRQQHPKADGDISGNPQAMAKLLKEADRVKKVLSANAETFAQVESLFQDLDFRAKITRQEVEEMFGEFEERLQQPVNKAMQMAGVDMDKLDRILLMGAGTRVPQLQELLGRVFNGKELSRNLNTDEAIALGAIYHGARQSKNFLVKRFDVVDIGTVKEGEDRQEQQPAEGGEEQVKPMDEKAIADAKALLINFEKAEKAKAERDQAQHQLESAVYDYTYKLEEEEFRKFGSQEELEQISKELAHLREWLEEMPAETGAEEFKAKKQELLKPIRKMKSRKRQKEERPEQMKNMEKTLDDADKHLQMFRNTTDIFTDTEFETLEKMIVETRDWFNKVKEEAEKLTDNQDATFSTDDLRSKAKTLDRESKFMFNRVIISLRQREEAARKAAEEEEAKKRAEEDEEAKKRAEEEASKGEEIETAAPTEEENKTEGGEEEGKVPSEEETAAKLATEEGGRNETTIGEGAESIEVQLPTSENTTTEKTKEEEEKNGTKKEGEEQTADGVGDGKKTKEKEEL